MDVQTNFPFARCANVQTRMGTGLHVIRALQRRAWRMQARRTAMTNFDAACALRIRLNDGQIGARNFFREVRDFAPNTSVERHGGAHRVADPMHQCSSFSISSA